LSLWIILVDLLIISNRFMTIVRVLQFNISTQQNHPKAPPKIAFEVEVCPVWGACDKVRGEICPKFIVIWKVFEDKNAEIILNIF
jgi:hypothetical protein